MKSFAIFALYFFVKNGVGVWRGIVGGFDVWLLAAYIFAGLCIFRSRLRLEIKLMYVGLTVLDGLLPLSGSLWFRWMGLLLSAGWLASYLWRVVIDSPSVQTPWKTGRADEDLENLLVEDQFPVFVYARDCEEVWMCESPGELRGAVEGFDVENGEYLAWDRGGKGVALTVQDGPVGLRLESRPDLAQPDLKDCLEKYARAAGVSILVQGSSEDAYVRAFRELELEIEGRRRPGFFRRFFGK